LVTPYAGDFQKTLFEGWALHSQINQRVALGFNVSDDGRNCGARISAVVDGIVIFGRLLTDGWEGKTGFRQASSSLSFFSSLRVSSSVSSLEQRMMI